MKCRECNGTGSILARNGIDFMFSPGLSSTVACKCPECDGFGVRWCDPKDRWEGWPEPPMSGTR